MTDEQATRAFAEELRKWWRFDDRQQHTHSWHDREDFIEKKLPELLSAALPRSNASPKGGGLCSHEIPLDWHCHKCEREEKERDHVGR